MTADQDKPGSDSEAPIDPPEGRAAAEGPKGRLLDLPIVKARRKVGFDPAEHGMATLSLEVLRVGHACPADLFLPTYSAREKRLSMNQVATAGETFKRSWRDRLLKADQRIVYVRKDEVQTLADYFNRQAGPMLEEDRPPLRKKVLLLQEMASVNLRVLFGSDLGARDLDLAANRAKESVQRLAADPMVLTNLSAMLMTEASVYAHSVNVCMLSMAFGRYLGVEEGRMHSLGLGALMHDVGMSRLPPAIVEKQERLNAADIPVVRQHPRLGYDMLLNVGAVSYDALMIVKHHHENADGSGYPASLSAARTPYLARLVRVVDAYDAMTTHRPYAEAKAPMEAAEALISQRQTIFGEDLVPPFVKFLGSAYVRGE